MILISYYVDSLFLFSRPTDIAIAFAASLFSLILIDSTEDDTEKLSRGDLTLRAVAL